LSYTTFEYRDVSVEKERVSQAEEIRVSLDLANTGRRDGEEVVQLYVRRPNRGEADPQRDLRAVRRVSVEKGQTQRVSLSFPASSLRRWDAQRHDYVVDPGEYEIEIAASDDIRLRAKILVASP